MFQKSLFLLICILSLYSQIFCQSHFTFTSNTGNNATVIIPTISNPNIDGTPLASGDEIAVYTPTGLCVGAVVWNNANTSVTVWGDNAQTPQIDGIVVGQTMGFIVWDQSTNTEIEDVDVTYNQNPPFIGNSIYEVNGLYNLQSLDGVFTTGMHNQESSVNINEKLITSIYPNPFNSSAKMLIEVDKATSIRIILLDILGKEIKVMFDSFVNEGYTEIDIKVPELSSGIYFLLTKYSENISTNKISYDHKTVLINKILLMK